MILIATSNSFDFTLTRNQIITETLETIGVLGEGETANNDQITSISRTLNAMVKDWQKDNIFIWKIKWLTQALTASSAVTGTDSDIYTCSKGHTSASNNKPVTGAYYTDFWKKTGSTGGGWVTATAYTAIGNIAFTDTEVIGIEEAFWRSGDTDTPLHPITREEYFGIYDKKTTGTPSKIYLEITQTGNNKIYLWPQPETSTDILHYAGVLRLEDFDSSSNNPDFDVKWFQTIVWNLSDLLAMGKYPVGDTNRRREIKAKAFDLYDKAKADANEQTGDIHFMPDIRRY